MPSRKWGICIIPSPSQGQMPLQKGQKECKGQREGEGAVLNITFPAWHGWDVLELTAAGIARPRTAQDWPCQHSIAKAGGAHENPSSANG